MTLSSRHSYMNIIRQAYITKNVSNPTTSPTNKKNTQIRIFQKNSFQKSQLTVMLPSHIKRGNWTKAKNSRR